MAYARCDLIVDHLVASQRDHTEPRFVGLCRPLLQRVHGELPQCPEGFRVKG